MRGGWGQTGGAAGAAAGRTESKLAVGKALTFDTVPPGPLILAVIEPVTVQLTGVWAILANELAGASKMRTKSLLPVPAT